MYQKELNAIKKANRYRKREVSETNTIDTASNDYLGLATNKTLLENAYKKVLKSSYHSPKSSIVVNGYSQIHKEFEEELCKANKFEDGIVLGSGFLANLSLIESLVRKKDILLVDEEYHASGIVATKLLKKEQVVFFKHNDEKHLKEILGNLNLEKYERVVIAIEGIYSMSGEIAKKEIFELANKYNALLIVDEAHSCGVIGENLLGVFDYYGIKPQKNHIKMGTLGKAYGSYGAYILASYEIVDFLINKAKAIIYTTALSLFDTALALESFKYIVSNKNDLKERIKKNQELVQEYLNIDIKGLIVPIQIGNNKRVLQIKEKLLKKGFALGAIRQPTVKSAIIRLIAKIDVDENSFKELLKYMQIEMRN